ncbi:RING finger protein 113A-like [Lingula anatina]|uniref:RING finger protein 113A-like n=1 Tax=Lingula anatina TaxID=7574 RepID=A0A1S3I796_LINAN|nr:RING finger protein 113A-like [Lingula anatina]|eukprot:XP_013393726.1 RING finger protein 113A-like [Lingula anatina]
MEGTDTKVCTFTFKKRGKRQNTRKRRASDSKDSSSEDDSEVVRRKKGTSGLMVQKTNRLKARDDVKYSSSDSEQEKNSNIGVSYKSNKSGQRDGPQDMGATATVEIDTEKDKDALAIAERAVQINKEQRGLEDDRVYRGVNNYTQFYEVKDTASGSAANAANRYGPKRAPAFLRSTVRWDYQPDICKDYKETGFCGFGDSCKFLHDRSDYKHGWQLEREMEKGTYGEQDLSKYEISSDEDDLPFACFICRKTFTNPVITKCKHYFCEKCALAQYRKSKRCFVCGTQTMGVFNPAKEIIAKMEKNKERDDSDSDTQDNDKGSDSNTRGNVNQVEGESSGEASEEED